MKLTRKTKRLTIRPLAPKDFAAWKAAHVLMSEKKNLWDIGARPHRELTRAEFKKVLAEQKKRIKQDVYYSLAVFDRKDTLVGMTSIMEVARGITHTAFLGYRIFNPYWGLGYGKEAVKATIDIAFRDIKLHRLEAGIEPQNARSKNLAKALGMRREGIKKRSLFLREKWVDLVMYTLTTEDVGIKFDASKLRRV